MESEHRPVDKRNSRPNSCNETADGLLAPGPSDVDDSLELACMQKLLLADRRGNWGRPLTADDLLSISSSAFEALFREPPIGPVPDYLIPNLAVYGCVAEYEEKLDELDRWKAFHLNRWLKVRIGRTWRVAGKVYQLQKEQEKGFGAEKFWFRLIEDEIG